MYEYKIIFADGRQELYRGATADEAKEAAIKDAIKRRKDWTIVSCEKIE